MWREFANQSQSVITQNRSKSKIACDTRTAEESSIFNKIYVVNYVVFIIEHPQVRLPRGIGVQTDISDHYPDCEQKVCH